ncbi:MAG TPA: AarF/ABC1/UbiB kinase family protein [Ktedonobacteraceae bacterium]|nr:AarF/ABC1/UbiB kinase family protein [Ktedonobacteraceae bacterium]
MSIYPRSQLARYREIAEALTRHGLGYLVDITGLERFIPFRQRRENTTTSPEHLRMLLEDLGITFIKLGQLLSTRVDLLPPEYIAELSKLQDQVSTTIPGKEIEAILDKELDKPVQDIFSCFEYSPLAAASIGQVHTATMLDATDVVVKIRRPGAQEQVEEDLTIIKNLADIANRRWDVAQIYDLPGLVYEFSQTLRAELDYMSEARNAESFAKNFAKDPSVHIPGVYHEDTTSRIITMERIEGIKINNIGEIEDAGLSRPELAKKMTHIILKMVFEDGLFHADLHPGNIFVRSEGQIGLIDFGRVGTLDERTQQQFSAVLLAVSMQDSERLTDAILAIAVTRKPVDRMLLQRDLQRLVSNFYGKSLKEIAFGSMINDALAIVRCYNLQLPASYSNLFQTIVMLEGICTQLDPEYNLVELITPYAKKLILKQYSGESFLRRLGEVSTDWVHLGMTFPKQLQRLLDSIERGQVEVGIRQSTFEPVVLNIERIVNRLVLGILVAALIIGLAIVLVFYPPSVNRPWLDILFGLSFIFVCLFGAYLMWTILRPRRK